MIRQSDLPEGTPMHRYRKLMLILTATAAFAFACSSGGGRGGGEVGTDAACSSAAAKMRSCNLLSEGTVDCEGEITDCHANCFAAASCAELETAFCGLDDVETTVDTCLDACEPQFACTSGETIDEYGRCDGWEDCADGSDEAGCPMFQCADGSETVTENARCDGCLHDGRLADKNCPVRPCVIARGIENCAHCDDYPCDMLKKLWCGEEELRGRFGDIPDDDFNLCMRQFISKPRLQEIRRKLGKE